MMPFRQPIYAPRLAQLHRLPGLTAFVATLVFLFFCISAHAQVAPSAFRSQHSLWVGADYASLSASFPYQSGQRLTGFGVFGDYTWAWHLAVEGSAQWLPNGGFYGSTEHSYLAGPRYSLPEYRRFKPYVKFLVGEGDIHYPFQIGDRSYFAIAPAGGANYRLSHRISLRAEYEYQYWLNSPGYSNEPQHPLKPNGIHVGFAYKILP